MRWDIHVLRAVAVTMVIAYHAGVPHSSGGSFGVDVFFVLSGFLITTALMRQPLTVDTVRDFYRKRFARTVPAAALVAATTLIGVRLAAADQWPAVAWHPLAALTGSENILMMGIDFEWWRMPAITAWTHYWSLAMEEQFYLVWPWLIMTITVTAAWLGGDRYRRVWLTIALLAVITWSASLYITWGAQHHAAGYFSPASRVWQLAVGAAVGVWFTLTPSTRPVTRLHRTVACVAFPTGVAAIAWVWTHGAFTTPTDSPLWGFTITGVVAVLMVTGRWLPPLPALTARLLWPVTAIATVSYGLYLWHWPLMWLTNHNAWWPQRSLPWLTVVIGGTIIAATLSWHLVEKPLMVAARRRPATTPTETSPLPAPVVFTPPATSDIPGLSSARHASPRTLVQQPSR